MIERRISFTEGQRVWFYNPRRKLGKALKLQSHWEGRYIIIKKLNDVVFCIQNLVDIKRKLYTRID